MDVHVHANCQAIPIARMLHEVRPDWHITWFEAHGPEIINQLEEHCNRIRTADLIISQPIHRGFRDREELSVDWLRDNIRSDATLLVFPSMHFSGHHPGLDGLPLPGLPFLSNLLIAHLVASGCGPEVAVRHMLSEDLLTDAEVETEIQVALNETKRREVDDRIDILISPFMEQNCRIRTMFHIQNHPFRETSAFIANQILGRLGLKDRIPVEGHDYQHETHVPPLPTVARFLRTHRGEVAADASDDIVLLPGYQPMTQAEYYLHMAERLAAFTPAETFEAIKGRWPTVQVLSRLAQQGSAIPGIARWS